MSSPLVTALERGTIRVHYSTVDFESAVRGLLVHPLLECGVSPARVDEIVESVLRREETGSTCAGPLALPHARVNGIPAIVAGIGVNPNGIHPHSDARVMLAFVSPLEAAGEHLRFLSLAARTFRDPSMQQRVQAVESSEELLALLRGA
jgi:PTS system nitrogen regulatory IIA component